MARQRPRYMMVHLPLWLHMLVLAGTFIGWIAISLLVDRIRGARERISDLLIEATIFTAVMTVLDYLTLMAMRRDRG